MEISEVVNVAGGGGKKAKGTETPYRPESCNNSSDTRLWQYGEKGGEVMKTAADHSNSDPLRGWHWLPRDLADA